MYNFNTTFMQRWRINLVVFGAWCWMVYYCATVTTDDGRLQYPDYPTWSAIKFGLAYLLLAAIICGYNQFIFQRDIKRWRELRRRAGRGEFEGTGNYY